VTNLIGYARVSTSSPDLALQHEELTAAGCTRIFSETASGALRERPELDRMLDYAQPGDTVVVWKLDRLGRSIQHLIEVVTSLGERGVGFRSLTEEFDTTTPGGKLLFHVLGALAHFERDLIRERTMAGLATARAAGRTGGRRPKLTERQVEVARQMHASGEHTITAIAEVLGVARPTVYRILGRDASTDPQDRAAAR
jgi:DNA invertase Pin-like site-specific DNA recombinase